MKPPPPAGKQIAKQAKHGARTQTAHASHTHIALRSSTHAHLCAGLLVELESAADVAGALTGRQQAAVSDGRGGQPLCPLLVKQLKGQLQAESREEERRGRAGC